ncbi:fimbrial biogenesis chaperone [Pseudomonas viridiflava]|uniref:fimbrial biogenesis chaperone n=1 Tax=Pseudomonas viridiflava TaxID=33069 RepID=UPI000F010A90|nr:molecular chaperone [Pseudomonas viridiflava]
MLLDFFRYIVLLAMGLTMSSVQAGIVLNTTRVIYQGGDKEASLGVQNSGGGEILLQSWLETPGAASAQATPDLPFIVTPSLARMAGGSKQLLRIIHSGAGLPTDRESVLWLNVQEIPQTAAENTLQIAIRQRIKVFFRPQGLGSDPLQAPEKLRWRWAGGDVVSIENPGPYHVSMLRVSVRQRGTELASLDRQMLAPHQSLSLPLRGKSAAVPLDLSFISINDFGGQDPYQARLDDGGVIYASKAAAR